ncbi:hypothetical protein C6H88_03430 [Chlamydia muridarum str. Nigg]|nr:hypothetical protein TAC_03500 [Chlamydia muridarum str. Nigg3 CMUT3-5]AHH24247.1 hypothetical protein Y015_03500 [Chlamydia muridarum str. Nigg CM972]AID38440.1 hypothetical protein BB17_03555 [Chlamydia muridarum str. Nigg 2 MCR]AIT90835.1 hypothetical protein NC80_03355 [Chlamydia muridarum]AVM88400.1 hypothetical protein C6H96_03430 [Chlamydia muridarum str. Nigg]
MCKGFIFKCEVGKENLELQKEGNTFSGTLDINPKLQVGWRIFSFWIGYYRPRFVCCSIVEGITEDNENANSKKCWHT